MKKNFIITYFNKKIKYRKMKKFIKLHLENAINDITNVKDVLQNKEKIKEDIFNKVLNIKENVLQDDGVNYEEERAYNFENALIQKQIDRFFNKLYDKKYHEQVSKEQSILLREIKDDLNHYYNELICRDFDHEVIMMTLKQTKNALIEAVNDAHPDFVSKLSDLAYQMALNYVDNKYASLNTSQSNSKFYDDLDGDHISLNEFEELKKNQELEDEMDAYALEEHEKDLVRKGEYDVWDFDTEEPFEDDDYYKDDV